MQQRKTVLILDDDYDSMGVLKEYLEGEGWTVFFSAGEEVLQKLKEEIFDLIILDLMIQPFRYNEQGRLINNIHFENVNWQKTGIEFLVRMRRGEFSGLKGQGTPCDVPVIVLSAVANTSAQGEVDILQLVTYYLEKPFRLSELRKAIQNAINRS